MRENLDVFVLTYNRAEYLKIMLESLCLQTAVGFKIKVLNNASTDNTIEIVEEIIQKYPERDIELINNDKNLGNTGNFIHSQELASNEYTAIFHDDDAIHPEYIETAMSILEKCKNAVMCTGYGVAKYNVDNSNWDVLFKGYLTYSKEDSVFNNLLIGRPVFACCIYKTEAYKKVKYCPQKYGKLHDILFMMEINQLGDAIFIQGICLRWRQHPGSDSYVLSTGPFPDEVINLIARIKELMGWGGVKAPLLWNFSYFLYRWGVLKKYLTWKEMCSGMVGRQIFSKREVFLFSNKHYINICNKRIRYEAKKKSSRIYSDYEDARF